MWGMMAERIVSSALYILIVRWRPRLVFSLASFVELFRYAKHVYGQTFLDYFRKNSDYMVVGRVLGAEVLAVYQFAYNIPNLLSVLVFGSVQRVVFPVYCQLQDDPRRLISGYFKTVRYVALLTFPVLAGLWYVADEFVRVVYGLQWLSVIEPLRLLCIAGVANSVLVLMTGFLNAIGRPDLMFKWNILWFPLSIVALIFAAKWGLRLSRL